MRSASVRLRGHAVFEETVRDGSERKHVPVLLQHTPTRQPGRGSMRTRQGLVLAYSRSEMQSVASDSGTSASYFSSGTWICARGINKYNNWNIKLVS